MKTRTFKLNKLVRDKIVQIHLDMDGKVDYETLEDQKLTKALINKLIEEAKELDASKLSADELADIKEILIALRENLGLRAGELEDTRRRKADKNGRFKKGHYIKTVTLPAENKWSKYYAADPKRFPEIKR